jgi:hypothetical protein
VPKVVPSDQGIELRVADVELLSDLGLGEEASGHGPRLSTLDYPLLDIH